MSKPRDRGRFRMVGLLTALLALIGAACNAAEDATGTGSEAQEELAPVTFRLDWRPEGYHAPFHLAFERGYYADEGLDIRIQDGVGSGDAVTLVGAGADTFGLASQSVMAVAIANEDVPVRAVAGVIQRIPDGIFSRADAGIVEPGDLEGTRWGATPGSSGETVFPAFADSAGIDVDAIDRVTVDAAAKLPTLIRGDVDWVTHFSFSQAPVLEDEGFDYNLILYADHITLLGHGLLTSLDMIEQNPDQVRGFVAASLRGMEDAREAPEEAVAAMVRQRPDLAGNEDLLERQLVGMYDFVQTESSSGRPLGWQAPEDWEASVRVLQDVMDMGSVETDSLYTNEFIPDEE